MYRMIRERGELGLKAEGNPPAGQAGAQLAVWRQFVRTGQVDARRVAPVILDSWQRCLTRGVEPFGGRCQDILSPRDLDRRRDAWLELAEPVMDSLHRCLKGYGFLVVLTDASGYLIRHLGDAKALGRAELINFGLGANWSETSVGTNAIGTALTIGQPVQVTGPEHFNDGHHSWTCAAHPFRDPEGRVLGCLDISGPRENASFHLLEMLAAAVRHIEQGLRLNRSEERLGLARQLAAAAFHNVSDGLISLDGEGRISAVNQAAARLLGREPARLVGMAAERALAIPLPAGSGRQGPVRELLELATARGRVRCWVTAQAIQDQGGQASGTLLALAPGPAASAAPRPLPRGALSARSPFRGPRGRKPALRQAGARARLAAPTSSTVLLLGESGTGKELFAQAIHQASPRSQGPFVSINCGALPRELIQSELFGYAEGAFTGARRGGRPGKLELAQGGTLFLDEIGDLPLEMQANLLRVLEEKAVQRVGGERLVPLDLRVVAATNQDLAQATAQGRFRRDLFYRLNVVAIPLPPLRERRDDIPGLVAHFLPRLAAQLERPAPRLAPAVLEALAGHAWPGNVRELLNVLEQALNLAAGEEIGLADLPEELHGGPGPAVTSAAPALAPLWQVERTAILGALRQHRGNLSRVARDLGIARNTLYEKLRRYHIPAPPREGRVGRSGPAILPAPERR